MKRLTLAGIWILLVFGGAVFLGLMFNPLKIYNYSGTVTRSANDKTKVEQFYDVNFMMEKVAQGKVANYAPRLSVVDLEQALYFSKFFGVDRNFKETEEFYSFENEKGYIQIDKFGSHIRFQSKGKLELYNNEETQIEKVFLDEEVIGLAEEFLSHNMDFFNYEEATVTDNDGIFTVTFIDRIGNLKNYAFPTTATLDKSGNILSADFYFFNYDRLNNLPIKTMEEAFYELPLDINENKNVKVDLKKCTLVYYYQKSIVEPCYLFEGELTDGSAFKSFISATIYQ